jgi:hypothetical protein
MAKLKEMRSMPLSQNHLWPHALLICLLLALHLPLAALGLGQTPDFDTKEFKQWKESIDPYQYWFNDRLFQKNIPEAETQVEVEILPSGKVERVKLVKSSGIPDMDLSCLASFVERGPYDAMPEITKKYPPLPGGTDVDETSLLPENLQAQYRLIFIFDKSKKPRPFSQNNANINTRTDQAPLQMHLIPAGIGLFYPGLFTTDEIFGESNVITIGPQADLNAVANLLLTKWQGFIMTHKTASKADIVQTAKALRICASDGK